MKKVLKILAAILVFLIVAGFLFFQFAIPPIAKAYVEKHSKEYIGRRILVGDFSWNLPSLSVTLKNVQVLEQDDSTEFVGFNYMNIDISPLALLKGKGKLESFTLKDIRANVYQSGNRFNFTDILEFLEKNSSNNKDSVEQNDSLKEPLNDSTFVYKNPIPELPITLQIQNINISNVTLRYKDLQNGRSLHVEKAALRIPEVYLDSKATDITIQAEFPEGGNFDLALQFGITTGDFAINMNLDDYALKNALSIARTIVNVDSLDGLLSLNINTQGTLNAPLSSNIKGKVSLQNIAVKESNGGKYTVKNFETAFDSVNIQNMKLPIEYLEIHGVNAHLDMFKGNKTNIDKLLVKSSSIENDSTAKALVESTDSLQIALTDTLKQAAKENAKESELPDFKLKKLSISDVSFTLNDYTLVKPIHYLVHGIKVDGQDISMNAANIKLHMSFEESGTLDMTFKGVPNELMTMKIKNAAVNIDLKKMALKPLSPYSIHYTGYPLSSGTIDLESSTTIKDNKLKSENSVLIDKINVKDKDKSVKPEYSVPMKIGLYVLKDRHDQIKIDMPVEGSIDDPQFSVGKVIWKTFCNLMIKVALTPTKLIVTPIDALTGDDNKENNTEKGN